VLMATAGALALASCAPQPASQATENKAQTTVETATATAVSTPITPLAPLPTTSVPAFRDAFVEQLFQLDPTYAVYQGRH
ncbi:hypothetical protein ABTD95_20030, partial [Acinetobacter baumannii]